MNKPKEMTAQTSSFGADDRQLLHVTDYSITNQNGNINAFLLKDGGRESALSSGHFLKDIYKKTGKSNLLWINCGNSN